MAKLTKKQKAFEGKVDSNKLYAIVDALALVKECATAKFDEHRRGGSVGRRR
jgi:large subunit ribosomal protein L1